MRKFPNVFQKRFRFFGKSKNTSWSAKFLFSNCGFCLLWPRSTYYDDKLKYPILARSEIRAVNQASLVNKVSQYGVKSFLKKHSYLSVPSVFIYIYENLKKNLVRNVHNEYQKYSFRI